jgi:hypothetical protein
MTEWNDLVEHVKSNYKVAWSDDQALALLFDNVNNGRHQMAVVTHFKLTDGDEHWVQISSMIGIANDEQLRSLVRAAGSKVCGGIASMEGDIVIYQHAFPLKNFDVADFERPLFMVTSTADELERDIISLDVA